MTTGLNKPTSSKSNDLVTTHNSVTKRQTTTTATRSKIDTNQYKLGATGSSKSQQLLDLANLVRVSHCANNAKKNTQNSNTCLYKQRQQQSIATITMSTHRLAFSLGMLCVLLSCQQAFVAQAYLYQPLNYLLMPPDDQQQQHLFMHADDVASAHQMDGHATGDNDVASIIGAGLERWRNAKMVEQAQQQQDSLDNAKPESSDSGGTSLASSVTQMLLSGLSDIAQSASMGGADSSQSSAADNVAAISSSNIETIDTTNIGGVSDPSSDSSASSSVSKADLKSDLRLYYNPKDTIQALRISSMATPSKHKKVYFRSEKKLDMKDDKSMTKPFNMYVQRRSSRAAGHSSAAASPGMFDKGVVDFMRRLRDVYIQTRPAPGSGSSGLSVASLASPVANAFASMAAASSSASGSSSPSTSSSSSGSSSSSSSSSNALANAANVLQTAASNVSGSISGANSDGLSSGTRPVRSPISAQSYVSFWSKTFPDWVRKMLKQLRRRSLQYRRQQQLQHQAQSSGITQASGSTNTHSSSH